MLQFRSLGIESLFVCFIDADYALFVNVFEQSNDLVLLLDCGIEQLESILHQSLLHRGVESCVTVERRGMIHLQQPRLASLVN